MMEPGEPSNTINMLSSRLDLARSTRGGVTGADKFSETVQSRAQHDSRLQSRTHLMMMSLMVVMLLSNASVLVQGPMKVLMKVLMRMLVKVVLLV